MAGKSLGHLDTSLRDAEIPSTKPWVDRSQRQNPRATTKVEKEKMEKAKKEQENMVEQARGKNI